MDGSCAYTFVEGASCDDGNACTVVDTCTGGACVGTPKVCNAPPAPACVSATEFVSYDASGTCNAGICVYQKHQITCAGGCVNDVCQSDPCAGITCNTPPSSCFSAAGTCQNGSCSYAYADGATCSDGDPCTVGDTCNTGVCKGTPMTCNSPPSSCFSAAGTCQNGSCSYAYADGATCSDGDPCTVGDTCNTGVCKGAPMTCNMPPADVCVDATTLQTYAASGTCSTGTCGYTSSAVACSAGCANGKCNVGGWTTMTSPTPYTLYSVWGTSANAVWAVGESGRALFYDGTSWQVRGLSVTTRIWSVSGTTPDNVFAVTADSLIFKFDGSSWSVYGNLPNPTFYEHAGIFVDGGNSLWIAAQETTSHKMRLFRSVNGNTTLIGPINSGLYLEHNGASVWAFSPNNVWISGTATAWYTGSTPINNVGPVSYAIWGTGSSQVFLGSDATLYRWNGGGYDMFNTGIDGIIHGISGTAPNRVFAAMWYNATYTGAVVSFDGTSVTKQIIPAGTPRLNAIWAAPTGEVFAVGQDGAIIKGP
ncbi:Thiamin-phosphate pyrophosphorylase [Minicystis rosea]|nr:Thiamin-phosphate pyrophosphorylase [Minicystis rosea]